MFQFITPESVCVVMATIARPTAKVYQSKLNVQKRDTDTVFLFHLNLCSNATVRMSAQYASVPVSLALVTHKELSRSKHYNLIYNFQ